MSESRKTKPRRIRTLTKDGLSLIALISTLLVARATIADHYVVPTSSMNPTVQVDDRLVVNKMAYGLRVPFTQMYITQFTDPSHGDVVVLDSPQEATVLLKRIVACPGDQVLVNNGRLHINKKTIPIENAGMDPVENLLGKKHPVSFDFGGGPDFGPVKVPSNKYLVMGDNRGQSLDGRIFGFVDRQAILGKGVAVYFRNRSVVWERL